MPLPIHPPADLSDLVDPSLALGRQWLTTSNEDPDWSGRQASQRLSALVRDPEGLDLAVQFVDRVARPESATVAARELSRLSADAGGFLSPVDRMLLTVGASVAPVAPGLVVPLARRRLRQLVGHLIADDRGSRLTRHLRKARSEGFRLNLNLLGEAVLGEAEAESRARRTAELLSRPDVDYVSVKVSALVSQISPWDLEGSVRRVTERLRPLYRKALAEKSFVNLDMEEYRDLDLTVAVFTTLLADAEFRDLRAGLALQAYLPDSRAALEHLIEFAGTRSKDGGAPIKVRLVKGANLSMETVEAQLHGWTSAPYATKAEVDANYLALVDRALSVDHDGLRVGVASHNVFTVAFAHLLAERREVGDRIDIEMLQGMAPSLARAVRDTVGRVILYTPVVARQDFDVAVAYLVRRLEENAQPQNFLPAVLSGSGHDQGARFAASVARMRSVSAQPRRTPERPPTPRVFVNTTDSDPALGAVREWAAGLVAAKTPTTTPLILTDTAQIDDLIRTARRAAAGWAARTGAGRATILRRAATELEVRRGDLISAMITEGGKTIAEADPEVSEAIDFARWYADCAEELDPEARHSLTDGTRFTPHSLVLVTPPWNFPVAIPTGGIIASLAAGSAVVAKPAHAVPRCTEIVVEALVTAGVPAEVVQAVRLADRSLGKSLVAHAGVDAVILTGSAETAEQFIKWRTDRPRGHAVMGETSGKNALVITPSADIDLAVADLVRSAFGHAGQKCSAASLAILVGGIGDSARFRRQLVDAVTSLRVGWPTDLGVHMGPLIEAPAEKLKRGLTRLEPGESWLVEPRQLDDTGRLWSPGIRDHVAPGSWFHQTECFGPVLGLMYAKTLQQAIEWQNGVAYGLTGGLHSLDSEEAEEWLEQVQVGNAYINRHITGAIVHRQSFGGWKASVVGPGAKAGGPDYVAQLGSWRDTGLPYLRAELSAPVKETLSEIRGALPERDRNWLTAAAHSDAAIWGTELGADRDAGPEVEENVLRHLPAPLTIRGLTDARWVEVVRVLLAALAVGTPARISLTSELAATANEALDSRGLRHLAKRLDPPCSDEDFIEKFQGERVRLIGASGFDVADRLTRIGRTVLAGPVLINGRRELLSVVRERAVSRTRHRYGHLPPDEENIT